MKAKKSALSGTDRTLDACHGLTRRGVVFLCVALAGFFGGSERASAQVAQLDDVVKAIQKALKHADVLATAGKAGAAASSASTATRLRSARSALALRARRAVANKTVSGQIVQTNLPDWSELRALEAMVDAELDVRRALLSADEVATSASDELAESIARQSAPVDKSKTLQTAETALLQCELDLCDVSALSGNRKIKGACGPVGASGSKGGDVGFEFGVGPGSVQMSTGPSGTSIGVSASLTDCIGIDFTQQLEAKSDSRAHLSGEACQPCGLGFDKLVALFDAPGAKMVAENEAEGAVQPADIEKLFGDPEDWARLRRTIETRSPDAHVGAVSREFHYLIEARDLAPGEELSAVQEIWRQFAKPDKDVPPAALACEAEYCPPNNIATKEPRSSGSRLVSPNWMRGSCAMQAADNGTNGQDRFWFEAAANKISVNFSSGAFPRKNARAAVLPVLSNRRSCVHLISGEDGVDRKHVETENVEASLSEMVDLFGETAAFSTR